MSEQTETPNAPPELKTPQLSPQQRAEIWKQMFFRAQAGMERYLVSRHGYGAIDEWVAHNAEVTAKRSDAWKTEGAMPFARNLSVIMQCWDSAAVELQKCTAHEAAIEITGCGILEYRKKARQLGIELTFDDPCREYCTRLLSEIARKQELVPAYRLKAGGCQWKVTRAESPGAAPTKGSES